MEVVLRCKTASVFVLDSDGFEVAYFDNVKVKGNTGMCAGGNFDPSDMIVPVQIAGDGRY
jgi:hypothetical protein